ncbi:MAG: hypothetical protein GY695_24480, partial [Aestuariibacter sp.]|nr:hypothetical protein [Aestuariibacter sp.]
MPLSKVGFGPAEIRLDVSDQGRRRRVRERFEEQLREQFPDGVLQEHSDEVWILDPDGSWKIHEEVVATNPDTGEGEAHVVLDRRTGGRPVAMSQLLEAEAVCDEAWEQHDDKLCCPRQMAAILRRDMGEICEDLSTAHRALYPDEPEDWESRGCTPRMILAYCKQHGLGCAVVHNEQVIETLPGPTPLAFAVHGEHTYMYKDHAVCRRLQNRRTNGCAVRLRRAPRASATPDASEWLQWDGEIRPGHFRVEEEEITQVRAWFLERG